MTYQLSRVTITAEIIPDHDADTSYLDQEGFEDRNRQYEMGLFSFIGVRARACLELENADPANHYLFFPGSLSSSGLWGIEDDDDSNFLAVVYQEQVAELLDALAALGISREQCSIEPLIN